MEQVPNLRLVVVDEAVARLAAKLAGANRIRGTDSLYVAMAQRAGFTLVTWDREQLQRGGTVAAAITPQRVPLG